MNDLNVDVGTLWKKVSGIATLSVPSKQDVGKNKINEIRNQIIESRDSIFIRQPSYRISTSSGKLKDTDSIKSYNWKYILSNE
jgi:hypothetical protein